MKLRCWRGKRGIRNSFFQRLRRRKPKLSRLGGHASDRSSELVRIRRPARDGKTMFEFFRAENLKSKSCVAEFFRVLYEALHRLLSAPDCRCSGTGLMLPLASASPAFAEGHGQPAASG